MATNVGQKTKITYALVNTGTAKSLDIEDCDTAVNDCNYITPVLASGSSNDLENDKSSVLGMFQSWTTSAIFVLQKKTGGTFIDKTTITDNSYGTWYPQGAFASKPKYAGFIADWKFIRLDFGDGIYRVKVTEINPLYPEGIVKYSMQFCLKEFTCTAPENTVRLDWTNTKKLGDITNDKNILDFGDIVWPSQLRVPNSIFGYPKSIYETEEIQYTNGQFETVVDKQTETYTLTIGLIPSYIHDMLKTNALMSGTLQITDYSSNNPATILQKDVKKKSGWEPRWSKTNKCAPVTIELEPRYNNLEIDRC